jgi:hypothetical protein
MFKKFNKWYKKCRIVKSTFDGKETYIIEQRHFLFMWWWVSATVNCLGGEYMNDEFSTLDEAEAHVKYYDHTKPKREILY